MTDKHFFRDLFISALLWCIIIAILFAYHWLVGDYIFAGTLAFTVWYIGFAFESAMNGSTGDEQWADDFPGIFHFTFTHILVPMALYFGTLIILGHKL